MGGASGVGSNQLAAPLGPGIAAAGVDPDRPDAGIVICAAHEGGIAVGRQRYRVALVGASAGYSVALSATGDTAIVGGWGDNSYVGAVGGVRSQQGSKLLSNDAVGPAYQGYSVALSADGNTALVGGANDNSGVGSGWGRASGSASGSTRSRESR